MKKITSLINSIKATSFYQNKKKQILMGRVVKGRSTKKMVPYLRTGDIALIDHPDIDELAVDALIKAGVKAVLNISLTITGQFYNTAPIRLLDKGIHLVELYEREAFNYISPGAMVSIREGLVLNGSEEIAQGDVINHQILEERLKVAQAAERETAEKFLSNTLEYARKEKDIFLGSIELPPIGVVIKGRDVVVGTRGKAFREELRAISHYIRDASPVLIGVDGGGDALIEEGFRPHIIIGDMDSVSDRVLKGADELIVHAYTDNRGAPGEDRLKKLGLDYIIMKAPGTSEDIALLLAFEKGAESILAVGTRFSLNEFMEKGRRGMSSTFLVRVRVADRLVDAKGVSKLYKKSRPMEFLTAVVFAGILPVVVLLLMSPLIQHLFMLVWWRIRLVFM